MPPFVLVTGNVDKHLEAERILGRAVETVALDLPELQAGSLLAVLATKGEEAWRRVGRALVVEESGLELSALNGFPGPFVKWMLAAIGPQGIARTALALEEPAACARCVLLYRDGEEEIVAEGESRGRLVLPASGDAGFGWDPVFVPEGERRTFGELEPEEKDRLGHRGRAWRALIEKLGGD